VARRKGAPKKPDPRKEAFELGIDRLVGHGLFRDISWVNRQEMPALVADRGWARVSTHGEISCGDHVQLDPDEWAWVLGHLMLHRGLGHLAQDWPGDGSARDEAANAVACLAVNRFLREAKLGREPFPLPVELPRTSETELAWRWRQEGIPPEFRHRGTAGFGPDVVRAPEPAWRTPVDWVADFAAAIARAASRAVEEAGLSGSSTQRIRLATPWEKARRWFVSSYPLLGGLAAQFEIVADAELARSWDISIAAVSADAGEIYINPLRGLSEEEWRFVIAHEMLHAALRHGDRVGGRDPYLWNCAADFVINGWLVEMRVGESPDGLLHDPALAGLSAEAVYDLIATDLRRLRKLATLRGQGLGDVLGHPLRGPDARGAVDLDEYYRRALATGLAYHEGGGRGLLPAGLVEEIRALDQPPLPWDAQLARWFEEFVPAAEPRRSYSRPSRRQSATPDIPRPGWLRPEESVWRSTFGVVLDTSGSMDRVLLGKALGAIASYAMARDVPRARVVFCDAAAYDAGYLAVEEIADRVRVRGRGGTVLQPGLNLLDRADDFPTAAPVLIITDGYCDVVRVRREHAFLVPEGARLPFTPRGPVFRMS
jgi:predicted metal-dependent peptidase